MTTNRSCQRRHGTLLRTLLLAVLGTALTACCFHGYHGCGHGWRPHTRSCR